MASRELCWGLVCCLGAGVSAVATNVLVKAIENEGLPPNLLMADGAAASAVVMVIYLALQRASFPPQELWIWLFARGFVTAGYALAMLGAVYLGTPIGDVSSLIGISNLVAAFLGRCVLKETLYWSLALPALGASLVGAALISHPTFLFTGRGGVEPHPYAGYACALGAGVLQGSACIFARKLHGVHVLYQSISTNVLVAPAFLFWHCVSHTRLEMQTMSHEPDGSVLWVLAIVATFCSMGPLQSWGMTHCPAALAAITIFSARVVGGFASDVVFFSTPLRGSSLCGSALLLVSSAALVASRASPASPDGAPADEAPDGEKASGSKESA